MATKAQLIAEIQSFYDYVGIPFMNQSSDEHIPSNIHNYSVVVYETGLSEKNKKPVLRSKYINFIVYEEGEVSEAAYYADDELKNEIDLDITSAGTLSDIHKMYVSEPLRGRVQAAIAKAAQDVLNEAVPFSNIASSASSGQKNVIVVNSTGFWIGKVVLIYDNGNSEQNTIVSINSNTLVMSTDLINSYNSETGVVRFLDNVERQQWAVNALLNPDAFTLSMTSLISLNSTIQSAGGLATDNDIQNVVNSYITKLAAASYL